MRIEMALPTLQIGGMEHMVVTLAAALRELGHEVGVTCLDGASGELEPLLIARGVRVSWQPAKGFVANFSSPALTHHFQRLHLDVLHSHSGVWGRACRAGKKAGVARVIHTIHGKPDQDPWYDIPLRRWEASQTDSIVAVSSPLATELANRVGVDRRKILVCENGIDTARFSPNESARSASRALLGVSNRLVFGVVARLAAVKNLYALLGAFSMVRSRLPASLDPAIVFVGSGEEEQGLRNRARDLQLGDNCIFLGSRSDTDQMHRVFDIFVLPSLAEGTSISLLEAMSSGTFVVATAVGSNPKLIGNDERGILSRGTDEVSIAEAMLRATDRMGSMLAQRAARTFVHESFSTNRMVNDYLKIYAS